MAVTIINNLPEGFQTDFLRETESASEPVIRKEGGNLFFPALVRQGTDGEGRTVFRFYDVPVRYTGQDIADYEKCKLQSYAELRKYFYGPATVQMEQQLKGTFARHQYAVKTVFPKKAGEVPAAVTRFEGAPVGDGRPGAAWRALAGMLAEDMRDPAQRT